MNPRLVKLGLTLCSLCYSTLAGPSRPRTPTVKFPHRPQIVAFGRRGPGYGGPWAETTEDDANVRYSNRERTIALGPS